MYNAYITKLPELRKHSNADRLLCATIFDQNVIVDLSYKEGDLVIFFPCDGQLGQKFAEVNNLLRKKDEFGNDCGGYLDPDKRNIRALKLRGEMSNGLVLKVDSLKDFCDVSTLKAGDTISTIGGELICTKYVPVSSLPKTSTKTKGKTNKKEEKEVVKYPFFLEHKDTSQLEYNKAAFKVGDVVYISAKLHGTSARTANALEIKETKLNWFQRLFSGKDKREDRQYNIVNGTRRVVLRQSSGDGYYGDGKFRQVWCDFFKDKLPKGMTVFYEIVGWVNESTTIMPICNNSKVTDKSFVKKFGDTTTFSYGCEKGQNDIYVYRMTWTNEDGLVFELPFEQVKLWCEKMGVKMVPQLDKFIFTTVEDLEERVHRFIDGAPADVVDPRHISEGVVVRIDNREVFTCFKQKTFEFKVIEGIIKDSATTPDMEEAQ